MIALGSCSRQFSVTLNEQSLYDPRMTTTSLPVADADLQGCLNLALRQRGLENPVDLNVLYCANANVADLEGIEQYTNLRFLDLANNSISNLQPLAGMDQLSGISIPNNPLSDISILLIMPNITSAILSGNNGIPCRQLNILQQRLGENLTRPASCVE
jgi:Leucine-rich repeat (LRR) protein